MEKEKRVRKEENDFTIDEVKQKRLRTLSKIIYIFVKIISVFLIVGIVGMFIAMLCVPIISSNVKIEKANEENHLRVFDKDFYYTRSLDTITIYEKDDFENREVIDKKEDIRFFNDIITYLEDNNLTKLSILLEIELVLITVLLFIQFFMLRNVYTLFKNIHDKTSPFIKDNIVLLEKIAKFLIISLIISVLVDLVSSILFDASLNISLTNVIEILVVYCVIYIFEYGNKIDSSVNGKIYSE